MRVLMKTTGFFTVYNWFRFIEYHISSKKNSSLPAETWRYECLRSLWHR